MIFIFYVKTETVKNQPFFVENYSNVNVLTKTNNVKLFSSIFYQKFEKKINGLNNFK